MTEAEPLSIVDAHQHFWELGHNRYPWLESDVSQPFRYGDYEALRQSYLPQDYRADAAGFRVAATVHVEAEWNRADPVAEQRWLASLRRTEGLPTVSVCHVELDREDAAEVLAAQAAFPFVRGVRHKPRAAQDPGMARRGERGSLDDPAFRAGFALLARRHFSFDLQTPFWYAEATRDLARDFPATSILINHTFLPADRSAEGLAAWHRALEMIAGEPNVALKISGLGLPGERWNTAANSPLIRDAIRIFGSHRALFASNYPVDSLVGSFRTIYEGFRAAVAGLPAAGQRALFHDNAIRLYRIEGAGMEALGHAIPGS